MTDAFWTAFFGNLPGTIVAIGGLIAAVYAAVKSRETKQELVKRDDRADGKLDHIKELTNSTMDALKLKLAGVTSELAVSTTRVLELTSTNDQLVVRVKVLEELVRNALLRQTGDRAWDDLHREPHP